MSSPLKRLLLRALHPRSVSRTARACALLAATAALLAGGARSATDISRLPLKPSALAKPNVVFVLDDSGSTDFEVLVDGTRDGMVWGSTSDAALFPSGQPRNGQNAGDSWYIYLFPNGFESGSRVYTDWAPQYGVAVPPSLEMAWTRSAAYNKLYYDSSKRYEPWAPATIGGTAYTFANADPAAARSHPVLGSGTLALNATVNVDLPEWRFTYLVGHTVPSGATNVQCYWGAPGPVPFTVTSAQMACTAAVPYYPATFWQREACTPDGSSCTTNFDGQTLRRYEIKSGNSFPSGRSYADEMQNFANWFTYHRKRKQVLAAGMGQVLAQLGHMRLGVVPLNNLAPPDMLDLDTSGNRALVTGQFYRMDQPVGTPTHAAMAYTHSQFDTNTSVVQYACQRNAMFVITDGFASDGPLAAPAYDPNTYGATAPYQTIPAGSMADKALAYFTLRLRATTSPLTAGRVPLGDQAVANPDPNPDLHLNTYGLTLGARGQQWPGVADPFATPPAWSATLTPGDPGQIDDLWHATINGRGQMYLATEAATTATAIKAGLDDFARRGGAQSSVAVSSVNLYRSDGQAYLTSYNAGNWTGDLSAKPLDAATGDIGTGTTWSAAALLNAKAWGTRVIASHNGSAGVAFTEANVGSLVNPGSTWGNTAQLMAWLRGDRSREGNPWRTRGGLLGAVVNAEVALDRGNGVAYLASGEGMLHAIDTRDSPGQELWAYVPGAVLGSLGASAQPGWAFSPLLDGSPVLGRGDASTLLLVGGLGSAGKGYYALDVSAPRGLGEAALAGKVKWEFPAASDTATLAKMGQTLGKPVFARLPSGLQVVLLSAGYNTGDGKGRLWMLNAMTGAVLHEFVTADGSTTAESGLAQVTAFVAGDGSSSVAYGGDLLGNLWRFDLVAGGAPTKLAQLRDGAGNAQPVTAAPELMQYAGQRVVLVGTGRLLGQTDMGSALTQSFYAIADGATLANARTGLVAQTYDSATNTLSGASVDWATHRGWYFDLPAGQQANTRPTVAYGVVAFTANQTSMADCSASSYLYALDVRSGQGSSVRSTLSLNATSSAVTAVLVGNQVLGKTRDGDGNTGSRGLASGSAIVPSKNAWREVRP